MSASMSVLGMVLQATDLRLQHGKEAVGILLTAAPGCTIARGPSGLVVHRADWRARSGEYRPWFDLNNRPLPPLNFWSCGSMYGVQPGRELPNGSLYPPL